MSFSYEKYMYGPLHVKAVLPEEILKTIDDFSNTQRGLKEWDNRHALAGKLDEEYEFTPDQTNKCNDILLPYTSEYLNHLLEIHNRSSGDQFYEFMNGNNLEPWIRLDSIWVNFQQKNNYNPLHHHSGDFSFVIYLDVPVEIYEEENITNSGDPGSIEFVYDLPQFTASSKLYENNLDQEFSFIKRNLFSGPIAHTLKPQRGDMFIFPSWLNHSVNAFKSDVTRITVAGNFAIETRNKK